LIRTQGRKTDMKTPTEGANVFQIEKKRKKKANVHPILPVRKEILKTSIRTRRDKGRGGEVEKRGKCLAERTNAGRG